MTVAELIMHLSNLPADMVVITQKDDEGNGYRRANGVELVYVEDAKAYDIELVDVDEDDCWGEPRDPHEFDEMVVIF